MTIESTAPVLTTIRRMLATLLRNVLIFPVPALYLVVVGDIEFGLNLNVSLVSSDHPAGVAFAAACAATAAS